MSVFPLKRLFWWISWEPWWVCPPEGPVWWINGRAKDVYPPEGAVWWINGAICRFSSRKLAYLWRKLGWVKINPWERAVSWRKVRRDRRASRQWRRGRRNCRSSRQRLGEEGEVDRRRGGEEMCWKCEKYLRGGSICRIILVILQVKIIWLKSFGRQEETYRP